MKREAARTTLMSYRPGVDDENDPQIQEALAQVQSDPELAAWYNDQCVIDDAIRQRLRALPVPTDLSARILSEAPAGNPLIPWTPAVLLRLAAATAVLLGGLWWWSAHQPRTFERFAQAMVHEVSGDYQLDTHAETLAEVRADLDAAGWPAAYRVPATLQAVPVEGGMTLRWRKHPISVVCQETETEDYYWLFVLDATALEDPPPGVPTEIQTRDRFATTAWSEQGLSYFLVGEGIPDAVQATLQAVIDRM